MAIQTTTFKGARYLVKFHDPIEWADTESYEAIEAVQYNAFTYISKQPVPVGVQIDNEDFWLLWADPNAQMEELRRLVSEYVDDVETLSGVVSGLSDDLGLVNTALPISEFSAQNTVKDYVDTTVENSIENLIPYKTVETYNDMLSTTEDAVLVLKDDSYYGSNEKVMFVKSDNNPNGFEARENGDVMIPSPLYDADSIQSNAPMHEIGEIAGSYIGITALTYATDGTALSTECTNKIDCSSFVQLVTWGIPFKNSRYVTERINKVGNIVGTNYPRNIAGQYGANARPFGYRTGELAAYYAEKNRLFYIDHENNNAKRNQIRPGDILFESDFTGEISTTAPTSYLHIHHCCLVLQVISDDGAILVAQAGNVNTGKIVDFQNLQNGMSECKMTLISISDENWHVFARPDYSDSEEMVTPKNLTKYQTDLFDGVITEPSGNAKRIATVHLNEALKENTLYTALLKADNINYDQYGIYMYLHANGSNYNKTIANYYHINFCHDNVLVYFTIPKGIGTISNLVFYLLINDLTNNAPISVKSVNVFEGYIPNPENGIIPIPDVFTAENNITVNNNYSVIENGKIHLMLEFTPTESLTAGDVIGAINEKYRPMTLQPNYVTARQGGTSINMLVSTGNIRNVSTQENVSNTSTKIYIDAYI